MEAIALAWPPAPPRPAELSGFAKRAWLLLYTEGGLWTAEEMRRYLHLDLSTIRKIRTHLDDMAHHGFVIRKSHTTIDEGRPLVRYSVDRTCKVPRGVTIDEMWDILQMGQRTVQ